MLGAPLCWGRSGYGYPGKICEFLEAAVTYTVDMLALRPGADVVRELSPRDGSATSARIAHADNAPPPRVTGQVWTYVIQFVGEAALAIATGSGSSGTQPSRRAPCAARRTPHRRTLDVVDDQAGSGVLTPWVEVRVRVWISVASTHVPQGRSAHNGRDPLWQRAIGRLGWRVVRR